MSAQHIDLLTREFLSGSSNPYRKWEPFHDLQDPTFLSFKIDFFPDLGLSMPLDAYSSGGLFRPSGAATTQGNTSADTIMSYSFYDSAAEYLARIGAPARQAALEAFTANLKRLNYQAPWYFQSISGLGELYKLDKNMNYRSKEKVLAIDCLESVDMRMSMLADLYRFLSFDIENHREVLPYNLRTFTMKVHVLEMRRFNTTFGVIADSITQRTVYGEEKQKELIKNASDRNVFSTGSSLFAGTFDNIGNIAQSVNNAAGGLFTNLGSQPGPNNLFSIKSAFEAISVQTFVLRDCEFDFFSESPGYLDTVSVKDAEAATFKVKIHVHGKIEKLGVYPFADYVISEWTKNTRMNKINLTETGAGTSYSNPYFERNDLKSPDRSDPSNPFAEYRQYRESIYPSQGNSPANSETDAYKSIAEESKALRRGPLENALNRLVQNATPYLRESINEGLGELTGGVLGTAPLGNIYGDPSFIKQATESLNDFLTPGNQLTSGQTSATANQEPLPQDIFGPPPPKPPHQNTNVFE
jgi:hypothetical protein